MKLQTAFAGGHRRTTETVGTRFFAAVTAAANGVKAIESKESPERSEAYAKAEQALAAAGI